MEPKTSPRFSARSIFQRLFPSTTPPRLTLFFFAIALQGIASTLIWVFENYEWADNLGIVISFIIFQLLSFVAIFAIAKPAVDQRLRRRGRKLVDGAMAIALALFVFGIVEAVALGPTLVGEKPLISDWKRRASDRIALTYQAGELLLDGENPYSNTNVIQAMDEFPDMRPTTLQQGDFADVFPHPTKEQIEAAIEKAQANPEVPPEEFESKTSYPAGSFLFPIPFVTLGLDLRLFYLLCALVMVGVIAWRAPPHLRPMALVASLVCIGMWNIILGGVTDTLFVLFLLLGWTLRKQPWASATCIGLAATCKQTAWFFLPFYLILVLRESGWRRAVQSLGIVGAIFAVTNIPLIAIDPQAWVDGVLAPMKDPMFPHGTGIVSFALVSDIAPQSSLFYTLLEVAAVVGGLVWYYFYCRRAPQTGLLLAMFPIFFAWRSLASYFALLPLLVFGAVIIEEYQRTRAAPEMETAPP